jgi:hypothetical protein
MAQLKPWEIPDAAPSGGDQLPWEIPDNTPGYGEDMAKGFGTGLVEGALGLGTVMGDVARSARNTVGGWMGVTPEQLQALDEAQSQLGIAVPSGNAAATRKIEEVTGPFYQAQTVPGQYSQTLGQFVPGMAIGPGSVGQKVGSTLLGAGGSETAGQMSRGEWYEPYARFAGGLLGGLTGGMVGDKVAKTAPAAKVPVQELEDLRAAKTAAYKAVDNAGVAYTPQSYEDMLRSIETKWQDMKYNPARHDRAAAFIPTLRENMGKPLTLTELDQLRQNVYRDIINGGDDANAAFGKVIVKQIDDMIDNASPASVTGGDPAVAADLINKARAANSVFKQSEKVMTKLDRAERQAAKTGKGTNQDNALRQKVDELINEKQGKEFKKYPKDVQDKMTEVVMGTRGGNTARAVGAAAPTGIVSASLGSGSGATIGSTIGGLLGGPGGAVVGGALGTFGVPAVGQVGKMIADNKTRKAVEDLLRIIQSNGSAAAAGVNNPSLLGQNVPNAILGGNSAVVGNRARSRALLQR